MADEWVSVRAMLAEDPKTITITHFLKRHKPFRDWLGVPPDKMNPEALCGVTLVGLIKVWAIANSRGIPEETDVLLAHANLEWVDRISKVPGLSKGMALVHWVAEEERNGVTFIRLPNFVEYNIPVEVRCEKEAKTRAGNRVRQQRLRDRRKSGKRDVTENHAPTGQNITEPDSTAATEVAGLGKGVQGERGRSVKKIGPRPSAKFKGVAVPGGFCDAVHRIVSILDLAEHTDEFIDQIGFLSRLAYAESAGFLWPNGDDGQPRDLWSYIEAARIAKRDRFAPKRNSAGYLTKSLRDDLGPRWNEFQESVPDGAHCQWLLGQIQDGKLGESFE